MNVLESTITTYDGGAIAEVEGMPGWGGWARGNLGSADDPAWVRAWYRGLSLDADSDRCNGIPAETRLVIPADCQTDPWGLQDRWVDAETGADVLPPDLPAAMVPTHRVQGEFAVAIDEGVEDGSVGLYRLSDPDDEWPILRIARDGTIIDPQGTGYAVESIEDPRYATGARAHIDAEALDRIAALLDGREWTPGDLDAVAEAVRGTGRLIRDPADVG